MNWIKVIALTGFLACGSMTAHAEVTKPTAPPTTKPADAAAPAVNKNCPMEPDKAVDKTVFIMYKGQKIGFCCEDCIKDFKEDPEKYVARMNKK